MKLARLITAALFLSLLSSCALIGSVLKLPASILQMAGRTVGLTRLTDETPDPVTTKTEEKKHTAPSKKSSSEETTQ